MAERFRKFVKSGVPVGKALPLTHATDAYGFLGIADKGQIEPQYCNIFGRHLVYLFYGRPSYRPNYDEEPSGIHAYFPVCLILRPDIPIAPIKIFPFDSGAFQTGRLKNSMHHKMPVDDFELQMVPESPGRLVSLFFGSNQAYVDNQVNANVEIPPTCVEGQSYHSLIGDKLKNNYDDRISAIELQVEAPIALSKDTVLAVILPLPFMDDQDLRQQVADWNATPLTYRISRMRPSEYTSEIFSLARDFYVNIGVI